MARTVGADAEVDLLWERVRLEGLRDAENGVGRTLLHVGPGGGGANGVPQRKGADRPDWGLTGRNACTRYHLEKEQGKKT